MFNVQAQDRRWVDSGGSRSPVGPKDSDLNSGSVPYPFGPPEFLLDASSAASSTLLPRQILSYNDV